LLWFLIVPNRWFAWRWHRVVLLSAFALFWGVQIFVAFAEYFFFEEFRSRFNTVAVDYLLYPHEVFINIWDTYPVGWVIAACLFLGTVWVGIVARIFRPIWASPSRLSARLIALLSGLLLTAALSRSVSLKEIRISHERVLNEIANNGALSFAAAF